MGLLLSCIFLHIDTVIVNECNNYDVTIILTLVFMFMCVLHFPTVIDINDHLV